MSSGSNSKYSCFHLTVFLALPHYLNFYFCFITMLQFRTGRPIDSPGNLLTASAAENTTSQKFLFNKERLFSTSLLLHHIARVEEMPPWQVEFTEPTNPIRIIRTQTISAEQMASTSISHYAHNIINFTEALRCQPRTIFSSILVFV